VKFVTNLHEILTLILVGGAEVMKAATL